MCRTLILFLSALVVAVGCGRGDSDSTWRVYREPTIGFEVSYPEDWSIAVRNPQPSDDFEYQRVEISRGSDRVSVTVNFQGGWCESGSCVTHDVDVSGNAGKEFIWDWDEDGLWDWTVRHFPLVNGRRITVLASATSDRDTETRIVQSVRFFFTATSPTP